MSSADRSYRPAPRPAAGAATPAKERSWYLVATEDRIIPPPAQREMSARAGSTVVEVVGSHAINVSQPAAAADLIKKAASEASSAMR